ncbi:class I adenylate-forming enzyme family protein [Mycobacterium vicinigordonae]|uniref:Acyl--CoA ligase n=1 Tax=Mycobacterium vicinigordonae TaxID=1719132 RepID=A0A7D6IP91_9MYCO|nr:class I adenylate-forming enzyme family protein [Mycobacterium vicinigordonae]QLL08720.1 acyl--CoA ligase [Mycobacterium vicinigordonae]
MLTPRRSSVSELLLDGERWADRDLLVRGDTRVSFRDHEAGVHAIAAVLADKGVGHNDRVMMLSGNHPETVACWWAVLQLGGVVVMGNGWWSEAEVRAAIEEVGPALVIADSRRAERVPEGVALEPMEQFAKLLTGGVHQEPLSLPSVDEDDPAVIIFTSGTTCAPKGVLLSHRSIVGNIHNILLASRRLPQQLRDDARPDITMLAVPLFHLSGIQTMLLMMVTGGRMVFRSDGRFDPAEILEAIEREKVTSLGLVPTMLTRVLDHPDFERRDTSSIKSVGTGGMPVPPSLSPRLRAAFPQASRRLNQIYGLSESGGVLTMIAGDAYAERPWSSGVPHPVVELRIANPDADGVGEVMARTPTNMIGYLNRPDDETVTADGWLHTGDLGRIREGHLEMVGRSKDIIIRAGENVAAPQVEARLLEHPAVAEVAVVGLPHEDLGEAVAAVVRLREGMSATTEELEDHTRKSVASFAVPSRWWFRPEPLPTNASGKPVKAALVRAWPTESAVS